MTDIEDLYPPKPDAPHPSDCCGTGCSPCVHDIYEQDLKNWKKKCENLCLDNQCGKDEQLLSCSKYTSFILHEIMQIAFDTYIYYFKLPDQGTFNLQVGQHIVIKGIFKNSVITRPYTPINVSSAKRSFELMIKIYPKGKMSSLVSEWKVGNEIEMRGPYGCFTYVPNAYKRIVMLAGGTGIAPMYEVIKHILNNEEDYTKIHLVYSSKSFKDILLREELLLLKSYWNFTMCHHLSQQESVCDKKYSEEVKLGRITKQDVEEEIRRGCDGNSLILISGTKSFDKDMMNAALNVSHGSESNIFKF